MIPYCPFHWFSVLTVPHRWLLTEEVTAPPARCCQPTPMIDCWGGYKRLTLLSTWQTRLGWDLCSRASHCGWELHSCSAPPALACFPHSHVVLPRDHCCDSVHKSLSQALLPSTPTQDYNHRANKISVCSPGSQKGTLCDCTPCHSKCMTFEPHLCNWSPINWQHCVVYISENWNIGHQQKTRKGVKFDHSLTNFK